MHIQLLANSANIRATATKVMKVHRASLGKLEQQTGVMCTLSVYVYSLVQTNIWLAIKACSDISRAVQQLKRPHQSTLNLNGQAVISFFFFFSTRP